MARELGEGFVLGQTPWLGKHHFPLKGDKEETLLAKGHFFFYQPFLLPHLFSHFLLIYICFYSFSPSFLFFPLGFTKRLHAQTNT